MIPLDPVVESYPASELHSLTFSARYSPPIRVVDSLSDPKIAGLNTKRRASERASERGTSLPGMADPGIYARPRTSHRLAP